MFNIIKQLSIILLHFSELPVTKYFLNDEPCVLTPAIIDVNSVEINYYPFMISLSKCIESCNASSKKIWVLKETRNINAKKINLIISKNEAKAMTEHISCGCKYKCNSRTYKSKQKWNNKTCQC